MTLANVIGIVIGVGAVFYYRNKSRKKSETLKEQTKKELNQMERQDCLILLQGHEKRPFEGGKIMTLANIIGIVIGAGAVFYYTNKRRKKSEMLKEQTKKELNQMERQDYLVLLQGHEKACLKEGRL